MILIYRKFFLFLKRLGIVFIFLVILFYFSCTKVQHPQIKDFYISQIEINKESDINIFLILNIYNPNDFDINITIKNLRHYRDDELLGYLFEERNVVLKKEDITIFNLPVVFKKDIFLNSLFSLLMNKDVLIKIQGEMVVHHWSGNYDIDFDKTFPINIKSLLGQ